MEDPNEQTLQEKFEELQKTAIELLVTVGLFMTVVDAWPEHVQENFGEKIDYLTGNLQREIEEMQQFAEAFDG